MFGRDVLEAEKSVALAVKARIADQAVKWIEKINDQLRPHNVVSFSGLKIADQLPHTSTDTA
jgi:hypothetical protein